MPRTNVATSIAPETTQEKVTSSVSETTLQCTPSSAVSAPVYKADRLQKLIGRFDLTAAL